MLGKLLLRKSKSVVPRKGRGATTRALRTSTTTTATSSLLLRRGFHTSHTARTLTEEEAGESTPVSHIVDVSDETWNDMVVKASFHKLIIVDAWADWCIPCRVLTPVLEECVGDQGGSVRLAKLDVTKHMDTAAQLNISAIPAVFAFSHGNIVESFVGGLPKHQVEKFIKTAQLHHARVSATASPSPSSQ